MNQEQLTIGYDEFMPQSLHERRRIFTDISAENRALLIKTHVERWLKANRQRLNNEQIAIVEEMIAFITPEQYKVDRDMEKIHLEAETLQRKAESVLSREDVRQIMSDRVDYIPPIKNVS